MSLHSTIYKINNNLISVYAILDSWCDRDSVFLTSDLRGNGVTPLEVLKNVLLINYYILAQLDHDNPDDCHGDFFREIKKENISLETMCDLLPQQLRKDWETDFAEYNGHEIRNLMREQLFSFLCLLDKLHSSRLDITTLIDPGKVEGITIMDRLAKKLTLRIMTVEAGFEYSSGI
jgi:hypothetical protein